MRRFLPAFIATLSLASAVSAPAEAEPFNGFFAGLLGGYEINQARSTPFTMLPAGAITGPDQARHGGNGFAYGLFLGYDFRLTDRVFIGIEDDLSYSTAHFKHISLDGNGVPIEGEGAQVSMKHYNSLALRFGLKLSDDLGVYGRVGLATSKIRIRSLAAASGYEYGYAEKFNYEVGAGLQYTLTGKLFSRLEYIYADKETTDRFDYLSGSHRVMAGVGIGF